MLGRLSLSLSLSLCLLAVSPKVAVAADANSAVPYHKAEKPIQDKTGKTRIIVDFADDAFEAYPRELWLNFDPKKDTQHPQVLALISDYEKRFGFTREGATTWVGSSVTTYLDSKQIELLRIDKQVKLVTEDEYAHFSAAPTPPPWYPAWNGTPWTELNDWGRVAVNGKSKLPGSSRIVYIIDSGVAIHNDLGSVLQRVNVGCGMAADCSWMPVGGAGVGAFSTVGCYAHATHVAGIIGATANNGQTRMGNYAGVNMVSIALGNSPGVSGGAWIPCSTGIPQFNPNNNGVLVSTIAYAFDFIYQQLLPYYPYEIDVQIATMSINSGKLGFLNGVAETNRTKMMNMVTPATVLRYIFGVPFEVSYPGVFFVQSAGNQNVNACSTQANGASYAFQTAPSPTSSAVDGIMVVGAIDSNGAAVSGAVAPNLAIPPRASYMSPPEPDIGLGTPEPGSNWGSCVDIWAPGNFIYSTWGSGKDFDWAVGSQFTVGTIGYSGGQPSSYVVPSTSAGISGWQWLSGTSMAAPHVAAAAAYLADKYSLTTPIAIETAVRQNWKYYGASDPSGNLIYKVYLPD